MLDYINKGNFLESFDRVVDSQFEKVEEQMRLEFSLNGYIIFKGYLYPQTIMRIEEGDFYKVVECGEEAGLIIYRIVYNSDTAKKYSESNNPLRASEIAKTLDD